MNRRVVGTTRAQVDAERHINLLANLCKTLKSAPKNIKTDRSRNSAGSEFQTVAPASNRENLTTIILFAVLKVRIIIVNSLSLLKTVKTQLATIKEIIRKYIEI